MEVIDGDVATVVMAGFAVCWMKYTAMLRRQ